MSTNKNIVCIFNKIYLSLIKELKNKDATIKTKLREKYKVFDKKSDEYLLYMIPSNEAPSLRLISQDEDILSFDDIRALNIFVDLPIQEVMDKVLQNNEEDMRSFTSYVYLLLVLGYIYYIHDIDDDKKSILLKCTIELMSAVNAGSLSDEDLEKKLDDVLDDDIKNVLRKIHRNKARVVPSDAFVNHELDMDDDTMGFLKNTKIGKLAQEISAGIDITKFNAEDMDGDPSNLFGGGGNMFGDIIQTVGSTITEKISSGEINQEELMNEAISMMGHLNKAGHGDMLSNIMGMMGSSGLNPGMFNHKSAPNFDNSCSKTSNKTRERLQRKIAEKKEKS